MERSANRSATSDWVIRSAQPGSVERIEAWFGSPIPELTVKSAESHFKTPELLLDSRTLVAVQAWTMAVCNIRG